MHYCFKLLFAYTLIRLSLQQASASECSAASGKTTLPLLELYTSEGCSSCPPADQWLSGLQPDAGRLVLLAFHVDYWNYIGWKDRFSKQEYTARQRRIAEYNHTGFVYTPQFVLNGRDFKHWDKTHLDSSIKTLQETSPRANLRLNINNQLGGTTLNIYAQAVNENDAKNSEVFLAVYENKLATKVNAGENSGRELRHDYVVKELFGAYRMNNKNELSKNITLGDKWQKRDAGVVVFVQDSRSGEILQSLQLPFCN